MNTIIQIAMLIYEVKKVHPELRLCQILSIAANKAEWKDNGLFYCSDETILKGLQIMKDTNYN